MAKFYGEIGFVTTAEDPDNPGVHNEIITKRMYMGDITRNTRSWSNGNNSVNDNIEISNTLSIMSDSFANENLAAVRYANWMGHNWKVNSIDIQMPRLVLQLGGIYNG